MTLDPRSTAKHRTELATGLASDPTLAVAHLDLGLLAMAEGQLDPTMRALDRAVAADPCLPVARHYRALARYHAGRFLDAKSDLDALIAMSRAAGLHFRQRALIHAWLERRAESRVDLLMALALEPEAFDAWVNLAALSIEVGSFGPALSEARRALALSPDQMPAWLNSGQALHRSGRDEEAANCFATALALNPSEHKAWSGLGAARNEMGASRAALEQFRKALILAPDDAPALANRSLAFHRTGAFAAALRSAQAALCLLPATPEALTNFGLAAADLAAFPIARNLYSRALAAAPGHVQARVNRGMLDLLLGDYAAGWQDYESRLLLPGRGAPPQIGDARHWIGETPIEGRVLLLRAEQGLGDTIQFCRYATLAAARGAEVHLEVPDSLVELLSRLDGVSNVVAQSEPLDRYDLHCSLMSLPHRFGTRVETIPGSTPYLAASAERTREWRNRLFAREAKLNVGIVWSGNPKYRNDPRRSLRFSDVAALAARDVQFHALQTDLRMDDRPAAGWPEWLGLPGLQFRDFSDTAATIVNLDLVISVDTSVAHLSGALGKPVWILLPAVPDWRWMLDRADSPWYPTARLFRQKQPGDWSSVLAEVSDALSRVRTGSERKL